MNVMFSYRDFNMFSAIVSYWKDIYYAPLDSSGLASVLLESLLRPFLKGSLGIHRIFQIAYSMSMSRVPMMKAITKTRKTTNLLSNNKHHKRKRASLK